MLGRADATLTVDPDDSNGSEGKLQVRPNAAYPLLPTQSGLSDCSIGFITGFNNYNQFIKMPQPYPIRFKPV